jgi:hypothetical protein
VKNTLGKWAEETASVTRNMALGGELEKGGFMKKLKYVKPVIVGSASVAEGADTLRL